MIRLDWSAQRLATISRSICSPQVMRHLPSKFRNDPIYGALLSL